MSDRNNYDNEDTMLLPDDLDTYRPNSSPKELPPLRKKQRANSQGSNSYNGVNNRHQFQRNINQYSRPQNNGQYSNPNNQYRGNAYNSSNYNRPQNTNTQYQRSSNNYYYDDPLYSDNQNRPVRPQVQNVNRPQHHNQHRPVKQHKRKHKSLTGKIVKRVIGSVLSLLFTVFFVYSCTSVCMISKIDKIDSHSRSHLNDALDESYVKNILLLGTDGRTADDIGRSDSIILISINSRTNELTTTSFMRDSYVEIPGYGWDKLNHSYAYGGADLLMETIENNFKVRIDDYVAIDFISFAAIVDSVGGLDVDISDAEANEINVILISEVNELMGDDRMSDLLESGGSLHLSGKQALSYARIRNVGNSDYERTQRQRRVIELIFRKLKTFNPKILVNITKDVIPDVSTNMSSLDMYLLSLRLPFLLGYDRQQLQIPSEGTFYGATYDVGDVLCFDTEQNYKILKDNIFDDIRSEHFSD